MPHSDIVSENQVSASCSSKLQAEQLNCQTACKTFQIRGGNSVQ